MRPNHCPRVLVWVFRKGPFPRISGQQSALHGNMLSSISSRANLRVSAIIAATLPSFYASSVRTQLDLIVIIFQRALL